MNWQPFLLTAGAILLVWGGFVLCLVIVGCRNDARALATFIPDCVILFRRLIADPRVPRRRKLALAALVAYLLMPLDLVPDFIPVAGQLDDAIIVALVVRGLLRSGGEGLVRQHWPGPASTLRIVLRLAPA